MKTLFDYLLDWANRTPQAVAQRYKQAGEWKDISVADYANRVLALSLFLKSRGFKDGDVSAIFSYNCPQWAQMDLAPSLVGGASAGVYPNSNHSDIEYILAMTQAKVVCVQNREYWDKLVGRDGEYPLPHHVETVIVFEGPADFSPKAVSYEAALTEGRRLAAGVAMRDLAAKVDPDACSFMIFTSGTTGLPKGAMITHRNMTAAGEIIMSAWQFRKGAHELFSFLPLSHIAEKVHNLSVGITWNFPINFCTKFDHVAAEITEVRPTLLLAVPRLWEKMKEGVERKVAQSPAVRQKLFAWALEIGKKAARSKYGYEQMGLSDAVAHKLADAIVLSKVRKALGFERLEVGGTGAAPIPSAVIWWFRALGIDIVELYGLTETSAVCTFNIPGIDGAGTVGKPSPGTEFRLGSDGEILTRGPHVFKGYFKNEEATRENVDSEGWLHTGDLGAFDERGFVKIVGRKREILKTSGGKMLAPVPVEEKLKACHYIGQICIVGDNKKYFVAVVTLSEHATAKAGADAYRDPEIRAEIQKTFDTVNAGLASFEQVKRFTILPRDFSIDAGEMTPTLKMKRAVIEKTFKAEIEAMYAGGRD